MPKTFFPAGDLTVHDEVKVLEWKPYMKNCKCDRALELRRTHSDWTRIGGYLWYEDFCYLV